MLIEAVASLDTLYRAWRVVRRQVRRTTWAPLSAELDEFDARPLRHLRTIRQQLRAGTYQFCPKWGYAKRKSGGSRRGITVHGVRDRIVQRSLLAVLQSAEPRLRASLGGLPQVLECPTSFAGNPGRGVPEAIDLIVRRMREGAQFVALSDVKSFFPCIPRQQVIDYVHSATQDAPLTRLLTAALETELANAADLEPWLALFPLGDVGVAQGSLLSVLAGNIALYEFDVTLNRTPWTTVRYLDDFAILGPDRESVAAGFALAQERLAALGMTCYAPRDGSQKADLVAVEEGFEFLGVRIHPDGVTPARRARLQLLSGINTLLKEGRRRLSRLAASAQPRRTEAGYAQILAQLDRQIRGWGDAFRFVSNRVALAQLDREIDRQLADFRGWYHRLTREADPAARRRIEGIALLSETPPRRFPEDQSLPGTPT